MDIHAIRHMLTRLVADLGSQRAAAEHLRISQAHLFDMLHGRRAPGPKVLKALGLRATVTYSKGG